MSQSNDRHEAERWLINDLTGLIEKAAALDRFYIPTRYPNGLPDLTPEKTYFAPDSQRAVALAESLLNTFRNWIES